MVDVVRIIKNNTKNVYFKNLQQRIINCNHCEHCKKCNKQNTIWGNENATVLVLLGYPSKDEKEIHFLYHLLFEHLKLDPSVFAFSYSFHCNAYYQEQLRPPSAEEASYCSQHIQQAIDIIEPVLILCFGTLASNLFYKQGLLDSTKAPNFIRNIPIVSTYPVEHLIEQSQTDLQNYNDKFNTVCSHVKRGIAIIEKAYPFLKIYN